MKKIKLFAGIAVAALSLAVFVSANSNESVASALSFSDVEAMAACEASKPCKNSSSTATCNRKNNGTCESGDSDPDYGLHWVKCEGGGEATVYVRC